MSIKVEYRYSSFHFTVCVSRNERKLSVLNDTVWQVKFIPVNGEIKVCIKTTVSNELIYKEFIIKQKIRLSKRTANKIISALINEMKKQK